MWLSPSVKASTETFKILEGGCRDLLVFQLPQGKLPKKFCLLNMPLTHLEWLSSLFCSSSPSRYGVQFSKQQLASQLGDRRNESWEGGIRGASRAGHRLYVGEGWPVCQMLADFPVKTRAPGQRRLVWHACWRSCAERMHHSRERTWAAAAAAGWPDCGQLGCQQWPARGWSSPYEVWRRA